MSVSLRLYRASNTYHIGITSPISGSIQERMKFPGLDFTLDLEDTSMPRESIHSVVWGNPLQLDKR